MVFCITVPWLAGIVSASGTQEVEVVPPAHQVGGIPFVVIIIRKIIVGCRIKEERSVIIEQIHFDINRIIYGTRLIDRISIHNMYGNGTAVLRVGQHIISGLYSLSLKRPVVRIQLTVFFYVTCEFKTSVGPCFLF